MSLSVSRKYEPHSFFTIIIQEQQNEHTLYNTFVTKMQASNDLFLRERLYGKVSALIVEIREFQKLSSEFSFEVQRKSNNFPRKPGRR